MESRSSINGNAIKIPPAWCQPLCSDLDEQICELSSDRCHVPNAVALSVKNIGQTIDWMQVSYSWLRGANIWYTMQYGKDMIDFLKLILKAPHSPTVMAKFGMCLTTNVYLASETAVL